MEYENIKGVLPIPFHGEASWDKAVDNLPNGLHWLIRTSLNATSAIRSLLVTRRSAHCYYSVVHIRTKKMKPHIISVTVFGSYSSFGIFSGHFFFWSGHGQESRYTYIPLHGPLNIKYLPSMYCYYVKYHGSSESPIRRRYGLIRNMHPPPNISIFHCLV